MEPMDTTSSPPPPASAEPVKASPPPPPQPSTQPPTQPLPAAVAAAESPTTTTAPPPSSAPSPIEITSPSSSSSSQNPNPSSSQNPSGTPLPPIPPIQSISQSPFPQFSSSSSSSSSSTTTTTTHTLSSSASLSSSISTSLPSSSAPPPFSATSTSSSSSSSSSFSTAPPPFSALSKSSSLSSSSSSTSSFSMKSSSLSSSTPPPFSAAAAMPRGGLAIGVPAHQARPSLAQQQPSQPPPPPPPFSSFGPPSFPQQFGGLGRSSINVPESTANQSSAQVRPSMQSIGMMGSLSSSTQMRPSGLPLHHQQRMVQTSMRSQSPSSNQSLATQKFQNHGLLRGPSVTPTSSPSPSASQGLPSSSQPWMSSATQLRQMPTPSLPSPSSRQPMRPQSLQQRPNHPQQHLHSMQLASHQQLSSTQPQQQQSQPVQSQDLYGQFSQSRMPPSVAHQQVMRAAGPANQKLSMPASAMTQLSSVPSGDHNSVANVDDEGFGFSILTKRSIRELVNQIGPSEKLDPEVEDFLMLTAEDFVDSITTYACSLAKHRKSTTLEAKDILLHLERNWNMTVPGFGGEEIKSYKKPITSDIHKERLVAIKKSMQGSDAVSVKSTGGQATGNVKGHSTKVPSLGSP